MYQKMNITTAHIYIKKSPKVKFLWFELTDKKGKKCYILNRFGLEGEWSFEQQTHSGGVLFVIKNKNWSGVYRRRF